MLFLPSVQEEFCPRAAAVVMGENMSKRLKLISSDAEMKARSFPNPFPDWDQGALTSNSGADVEYQEPIDAEGKVRGVFVCVLKVQLTVELKPV